MVVVSKVKHGFGFGCVFTSCSRLSFIHPVQKHEQMHLPQHVERHTQTPTQSAVLNHRVSLLHLSPSLPESSSNTCTACLWYCSWDSTRDDSWLTCSIYTHTHTQISSLSFTSFVYYELIFTVKQFNFSPTASFQRPKLKRAQTQATDRRTPEK